MKTCWKWMSLGSLDYPGMGEGCSFPPLGVLKKECLRGGSFDLPSLTLYA